MTSLRKDALRPESFGAWIDALIIENIRMWHEQERVYEVDRLEAMPREDLVSFLKAATWINLKRNEAIDHLDAHLARARFPGVRVEVLPPKDPSFRILEAT